MIATDALEPMVIPIVTLTFVVSLPIFVLGLMIAPGWFLLMLLMTAPLLWIGFGPSS